MLIDQPPPEERFAKALLHLWMKEDASAWNVVGRPDVANRNNKRPDFECRSLSHETAWIEVKSLSFGFGERKLRAGYDDILKAACESLEGRIAGTFILFSRAAPEFKFRRATKGDLVQRLVDAVLQVSGVLEREHIGRLAGEFEGLIVTKTGTDGSYIVPTGRPAILDLSIVCDEASRLLKAACEKMQDFPDDRRVALLWWDYAGCDSFFDALVAGLRTMEFDQFPQLDEVVMCADGVAWRWYCMARLHLRFVTTQVESDC